MGGSRRPALVAVPVTFRLVAWAAVAPRLMAVTAVGPPKAPCRSTQSAYHWYWALSWVAAVSRTRTLTVSSIPARSAILAMLGPASAGHSRTRTTNTAM